LIKLKEGVESFINIPNQNNSISYVITTFENAKIADMMI